MLEPLATHLVHGKDFIDVQADLWLHWAPYRSFVDFVIKFNKSTFMLECP